MLLDTTRPRQFTSRLLDTVGEGGEGYVEMATIQLGSKEKPVRVNCDTANHYRWLYVKVNYEQQQLIDTLEMQEGDRLLQDFKT